MARNRKKRRQQHGSAWHWRQTDAWYYTEPGTKKRVPLFDEKGERIRGKENKETARMALARIKVGDELSASAPPASDVIVGQRAITIPVGVVDDGAFVPRPCEVPLLYRPKVCGIHFRQPLLQFFFDC